MTVVTLQFYNNFDTLLKISKIFHRLTLAPKILKKFIVIYSKKIHFCDFFRIFRAYELSEKNKSEKNVFEVRKRKLAPKILKKFTEVYFFTIIDRFY